MGIAADPRYLDVGLPAVKGNSAGGNYRHAFADVFAGMGRSVRIGTVAMSSLRRQMIRPSREHTGKPVTRTVRVRRRITVHAGEQDQFLLVSGQAARKPVAW